MQIYLINVLIAALTWLISINSIGADCVCNTRFNGEYCGARLNAENGNTDCSRDMFYCGKNNRNQPAVMIRKCQKGLECDVTISGGNACLQSLLQCQCGDGLRRRRKYCGSQLTGSHCSPNIIYQCPLFKRYNPSVVDACPYGCAEGRCLEAEQQSDNGNSETP